MTFYQERVVDNYEQIADRAARLNTFNAHYALTEEAQFHTPELCWYCDRDKGESK